MRKAPFLSGIIEFDDRIAAEIRYFTEQTKEARQSDDVVIMIYPIVGKELTFQLIGQAAVSE